MLRCKLSRGISPACSNKMGGILKMAVANWDSAYMFDSSSGGCIDTIDMGNEKIYSFDVNEGTGYATSTGTLGANNDSKYHMHTVGGTFFFPYCEDESLLSLFLGRIIIFVMTKNHDVYAFGVDNGLTASTFEYTTGAAEGDATGVNFVYEGAQTDSPLKLSSWDIVENQRQYRMFAYFNDGTFKFLTKQNRNNVASGETHFTGYKDVVDVKLQNIATVGIRAFSGYSSLRSVEMTNDITTIETSAFAGCSKLTSIKLSKNLATIGTLAFSSNYKLANINIPDSVTSIGNNAFNGCTGLTSVKLSSGLTTLNFATFGTCTSLPSIVIPNSVTTIGESVFNGCTGLTTVTIPDSVTTIGQGVFSGCRKLKNITIPSGVTVINNSIFNRLFRSYKYKYS